MQVRTLQVAYDLTVEPTSFSSTPTKKRLSRKVAVCEEDFVAPKVIVKKKPRLVLSPITVRQQESTSAPPPVKPSPIIPIKRLVKPKIEEIPLPPPIKAKHYDPKVVKSYMEKKAKEKKQEERFLSQNQAALKAEVKEKLTKLNNFRQEQLATIKVSK